MHDQSSGFKPTEWQYVQPCLPILLTTAENNPERHCNGGSRTRKLDQVDVFLPGQRLIRLLDNGIAALSGVTGSLMRCRLRLPATESNTSRSSPRKYFAVSSIDIISTAPAYNQQRL